METAYLESFLLVVETGSMAEAARRLAKIEAAEQVATARLEQARL